MKRDLNVMINDLNIKVDRDLCYACGTCVERCILDNLALSVAPCRQVCPLKMNCQGYIRLLAQGKEKEAAQEMCKASPFSRILGRVCHHPCESACERGKIDEAVQIRALKRYLADTLPDISLNVPETASETQYKVAIIGSGPAGLSSAYELRLLGHQVTVFEADKESGGLLRYGIPSFRLPVEEVDNAVNVLQKMGVTFKNNQSVGKQLLFDDIVQQYDAVLMATGASKSLPYHVEGCEQAKILDGLHLLKGAKTGQDFALGKSVAVIGGGNSAVDAALVSRRMGAEIVYLICLECTEEMPAFETEVQQAIEENIILQCSSGVKRINCHSDGSLGLELANCLSLFDESGRFNPELSLECTLELKADSVVAAIGQKVNTDQLSKKLLNSETGTFSADPLTGQHPTNDKVFSCGDCVDGPSSVVDAFAAGKEAAISIDRFIRGDGLSWGRGFWNTAYREEYLALAERADGKPRLPISKLPLSKRSLSAEIELPFSPTDAVKEAERCLSCGRAFEIAGTCWSCLPCEIECPVDAIEVQMPYLLR